MVCTRCWGGEQPKRAWGCRKGIETLVCARSALLSAGAPKVRGIALWGLGLLYAWRPLGGGTTERAWGCRADLETMATHMGLHSCFRGCGLCAFCPWGGEASKRRTWDCLAVSGTLVSLRSALWSAGPQRTWDCFWGPGVGVCACCPLGGGRPRRTCDCLAGFGAVVCARSAHWAAGDPNDCLWVPEIGLCAFCSLGGEKPRRNVRGIAVWASGFCFVRVLRRGAKTYVRLPSDSGSRCRGFGAYEVCPLGGGRPKTHAGLPPRGFRGVGCYAFCPLGGGGGTNVRGIAYWASGLWFARALPFGRREAQTYTGLPHRGFGGFGCYTFCPFGRRETPTCAGGCLLRDFGSDAFCPLRAAGGTRMRGVAFWVWGVWFARVMIFCRRGTQTCVGLPLSFGTLVCAGAWAAGGPTCIWGSGTGLRAFRPLGGGGPKICGIAFRGPEIELCAFRLLGGGRPTYTWDCP